MTTTSKALVLALLAAVSSAFAQEKPAKVTVLLDWFANPDLGTLIVAKQKGYFQKHGLDVDLIEPTDPSMPPKLVAAGQGDIAVDYQPQLQIAAAKGLPLVRIGTLMSSPLNTLMTLKENHINTIADLKGKTIGYSVSGFEESLLDAMLKEAGLTRKDVKLVNVNFSLVPSLLTHKVDAVLGAYRNVELKQLDLEKRPGLAFYPEEHGVPAYDEMTLVVNGKKVKDPRWAPFLDALEEATIFTANHPDEAYEAFIAYKPGLDTPLNRLAWKATVPRFALRPRALDTARYQRTAAFLKAHGIIDNTPPVATYAVEIPATLTAQNPAQNSSQNSPQTAPSKEAK